MSLKIKICGMREPDNIIEVAELMPDLMGFIFYPFSPRYANETLYPEILARLSPAIRKTGVFVNTDIEMIIRSVSKYSLDIVQLHGNETPDICRLLNERGIPVIKAFNIKDSISFRSCLDFISCTDYFLFDSCTSDHGGSGSKFNWEELNKYDLGHPFFLSGGITPNDITNILAIDNPEFYGIDLNSRFEIKPGKKDPEILKQFISEIRFNTKSL